MDHSPGVWKRDLECCPSCLDCLSSRLQRSRSIHAASRRADSPATAGLHHSVHPLARYESAFSPLQSTKGPAIEKTWDVEPWPLTFGLRTPLSDGLSITSGLALIISSALLLYVWCSAFKTANLGIWMQETKGEHKELSIFLRNYTTDQAALLEI